MFLPTERSATKQVQRWIIGCSLSGNVLKVDVSFDECRGSSLVGAVVFNMERRVIESMCCPVPPQGSVLGAGNGGRAQVVL